MGTTRASVWHSTWISPSLPVEKLLRYRTPIIVQVAASIGFEAQTSVGGLR